MLTFNNQVSSVFGSSVQALLVQDIGTDRRTGWFLYVPKTLFAEGFN